MAVRLSALRVVALYPSGRYLVFLSVRGCVNLIAIVRLKKLGPLKSIAITSYGNEPATFRFVA
jgi:hypothetical protein